MDTIRYFIPRLVSSPANIHCNHVIATTGWSDIFSTTTQYLRYVLDTVQTVYVYNTVTSIQYLPTSMCYIQFIQYNTVPTFMYVLHAVQTVQHSTGTQ